MVFRRKWGLWGLKGKYIMRRVEISGKQENEGIFVRVNKVENMTECDEKCVLKCVAKMDEK